MNGLLNIRYDRLSLVMLLLRCHLRLGVDISLHLLRLLRNIVVMCLIQVLI